MCSDSEAARQPAGVGPMIKPKVGLNSVVSDGTSVVRDGISVMSDAEVMMRYDDEFALASDLFGYGFIIG